MTNSWASEHPKRSIYVDDVTYGAIKKMTLQAHTVSKKVFADGG